MTIGPNCEKWHAHRSRAIGYLRTDVSLDHQPRHTDAMRRLARRQGLTLIYTVRLGPDSVPDLIGHVLDLVRATGATTLIVPDLAHLENHPGRVCDTCDLLAVCPEQLWMKAGTNTGEPIQEPVWLPELWHSEPDTRLRITDAHRIMQSHRACNPLDCPHKAAAFTVLTETGRLVPATRSPRERAAARGLHYPPAEPATTSAGPPIALLHRLLTGLTQA
ncbi:hypothetical protein [Nocardia carnea]|uniref:hypothetical protein n=1 Tax=Nocardia carnea TaxID=37328 RepID=UPI0024579C4F|nr:hypothetical protein [Nocardia carnea]